MSNIQVLRAAAALLVVFLHTTGPGGLRSAITFGSFGVDIFFVISGFIISHVTFRDSSQFIPKRLIRIVPFYWLATTCVFGLAWIAPSLLNHTSPDVSLLIHSLFFVPEAHDGNVMPLLALGWTLNLEMYFYLMFAIGLWTSPRHARAICAGLIAAIIVIIYLAPPVGPVIASYGQQKVWEFVLGIGLFQWTLWKPGFFQPARKRDRLFFIVIALLALSAAFLPLGERFAVKTEYWLLFQGIPAFILVAAMIVLDMRYSMTTRSRLLLLLGEASFILYLIHPYIAFGILRLGFRQATHWPDWEKLALALALTALAALVATLLHLYYERPAMAVLRRRLLHKPLPVIYRSGS